MWPTERVIDVRVAATVDTEERVFSARAQSYAAAKRRARLGLFELLAENDEVPDPGSVTQLNGKRGE